jgi:hypothetical protein
VRSPARYLAATSPDERIEERRAIVAPELPFEYCLNALRLTDGFSSRDYEIRTGLARESLDDTCEAAVSDGLLERDFSAGRLASDRAGPPFSERSPGPIPALSGRVLRKWEAGEGTIAGSTHRRDELCVATDTKMV